MVILSILAEILSLILKLTALTAKASAKVAAKAATKGVHEVSKVSAKVATKAIKTGAKTSGKVATKATKQTVKTTTKAVSKTTKSTVKKVADKTGKSVGNSLKKTGRKLGEKAKDTTKGAVNKVSSGVTDTASGAINKGKEVLGGSNTVQSTKVADEAINKDAARLAKGTAKLAGGAALKTAKLGANVALGTAKFAVKSVVRFILNVVIWVIRLIVCTLGVVYAGVFFIVIAACAVIIPISAYIVLDGDFSTTLTYNSTVASSTTTSTGVGDYSNIGELGYVIMADMVNNSCKYFDTYNDATHTTSYYTLDSVDTNMGLSSVNTIRTDCTGFVIAVMATWLKLNGDDTKLYLTSSGSMLYGSDYCALLESCGFTAYKTTDITVDDLQCGDILGVSGHFTMYYDATSRLDYGSMRDDYPQSATWLDCSDGTITSYANAYRKYTVMYRYTG